MYGAILGDMIGSPFEFDRGKKTKEFPLFSKHSTYTDDSVMTIAVGDAFLDAQPNAADDWTMQRLIRGMQRWGRNYPHTGYGGNFRWWLRSDDPKPYGSYCKFQPLSTTCTGKQLYCHGDSAPLSRA